MHEEKSQLKHIRCSRKDWTGIVNAWHNSGLTQRSFCSQHGIALSSFAKWRQKVSTEPAPVSTSGSGQFVNVFSGSTDDVAIEAEDELNKWRIELDLGDITLRLSRG